MTTSKTLKGRIHHERGLVPVPREIRVAISMRFTSAERAAEGLGVGYVTAEALLDPYGRVRLEDLERVRARLAEAKSA